MVLKLPLSYDKRSKEDFAILASTLINFRFSDDKTDLRSRVPMIELNDNNEISQSEVQQSLNRHNKMCLQTKYGIFTNHIVIGVKLLKERI